MSPVTRFFLAASASQLAVAAGAVLDMPITVTDGYKTVDLDIGTPAKTYRLLFDTGSASSWAVDQNCARTTCPRYRPAKYEQVGYDIASSSTGNLTGGYGNIAYLGGDVAGPAVADVWTAEGELTWTQSFIAASESSWSSLAADGFLGMAFSSIIDGGANTIMETLMGLGLVDAAKFGIYYGAENEDTGDKPGEGILTLGGSREADYVDGELVSIPITRVWPDYYDVWRSSILAVNVSRPVGEAVENTKTDFSIGNVVFDTGAAKIMFPDALNDLIYESMGMNYTAMLWGDHIPLCTEFNETLSVTFSFGDYRDPKTVTIRGDQLRRPGFANRDDACWPPFENSGSSGLTLIGTPLLRLFYTVWDFGSSATETDISMFNPTLSFGQLKSEIF